VAVAWIRLAGAAAHKRPAGGHALIIDAHQHFWRVARGDYGWLEGAPPDLRRDFDPDDLAPLLAAGGVRRTVLVQAAPTRAETAFLVELAQRTPFVAAVVGWADLEAADIAAQLARLAKTQKLVGVRPMIQDIADPDWMLRAGPRAGFAALEASGLRLDALVRPEHLPRLARLAERHPGLPIVVDHCAKPDIAGGDLARWAEDLARLARAPAVACKLSGLLGEAGPGAGDADLAPAVEHVLKVFGPERVMWGSDWPILTLAGDYAGWLARAKRLVSGLAEADQDRVFAGTAERFYGI
jgi:L-fuconolactonase